MVPVVGATPASAMSDVWHPWVPWIKMSARRYHDARALLLDSMGALDTISWFIPHLQNAVRYTLGGSAVPCTTGTTAILLCTAPGVIFSVRVTMGSTRKPSRVVLLPLLFVPAAAGSHTVTVTISGVGQHTSSWQISTCRSKGCRLAKSAMPTLPCVSVWTYGVKVECTPTSTP